MRNSTKLACGSDAKIARAPQSETYLYTASPNAYPIDVLSLVGCSMAASTSVALLTELVTVTATRSRLVVPKLTVSGNVRLLEQSWLQSSVSNDFEVCRMLVSLCFAVLCCAHRYVGAFALLLRVRPPAAAN